MFLSPVVLRGQESKIDAGYHLTKDEISCSPSSSSYRFFIIVGTVLMLILVFFLLIRDRRQQIRHVNWEVNIHKEAKYTETGASHEELGIVLSYTRGSDTEIKQSLHLKQDNCSCSHVSHARFPSVSYKSCFWASCGIRSYPFNSEKLGWKMERPCFPLTLKDFGKTDIFRPSNRLDEKIAVEMGNYQDIINRKNVR